MVRAGGRDLYKGFEWSQATEAILMATNDQKMVQHIIKRMGSNEARHIKEEEQAVITIKTPKLAEKTLGYIKKILEPHEVKIEIHTEPEEGERHPYWLLLLPEGAKKEQDGFTGAYHEHNKITLPDGFFFFQEVDAEGWSTISFPVEEKQQ